MNEKIVAFQDALGKFCAGRGFKFGKWPRPTTAQVYDVLTPSRVSMYVKQNADRPRWWGISKQLYARKLASLNYPWSLVLLVGDGERGYALSSTQVSAMISGLTSNSHDHIVHEEDAMRGFRFDTFDALFRYLLP